MLHKNWIENVPDSVKFTDYYNQGDKIRVKAAEFKVIKGEKRVVWSQIN
ncbi:MAG: hypothetical protein H6766_07860 [Candidatus Peribacteria bacterium]|nr:MAG: hypothetical protein H6766_07860 [Candidatus Peribacteria bacterium]